MSRCFPFPPPGYEKKITTDETDPLIKKYKEKKLQKDKDKEKKEKKSKDRSKDNHKERKEKKEKHKDRKDKENYKEKSKPLEEKKAEVLTNTVQNNSNGKSKYVQDLARRIRHEEEATGSQSAQKINYPSSKDLGKTFENSSFCSIQEINHREGDDERISTQKNVLVAKSSENDVYRVSFGAYQKGPEVMGKPMESIELVKQTESPEKSHLKENAIKSDKPRDKEGLKKNEAKDKDRHKEKKEAKTKSINQIRQEKPKLIRCPKLEERDQDTLDLRNCKPPDLSQASVKNPMAEGILGKRKDHETNGFLYENGTTPNKSLRHSVSVSSSENGRRVGATMPASDVQGTDCKREVKEVRVNGFVVSGEKQKVCPPNSSATTMKVKVNENGELSSKPPHPDLKYLDQILNVPRRELVLEVDNNQEWLGGQSGVKLKKTRTDTSDYGVSLQVWNQAFRIESTDVVALPYVVPF